jgi:hypothetical protein
MENCRELTEVEFDRLIAGEGPFYDPALQNVDEFVREIRAAYGRPMSRPIEMGHIAAMVEESRSKTTRSSLLAQQLEGLKATLGPLFRVPSVRTRKIVFANLLGSAVGKAVLALTAAAATTTGLAATGTLPPPIQAVVVSAAHNLGFSDPEPTPSPSHRPPPRVPINLPEVPQTEPVAPADPLAQAAAPPEPPTGTAAAPPGNAATGAPGRLPQSNPYFTDSNRDSRTGNATGGAESSSPPAGENDTPYWWDYYNDSESGQTGSGQDSSNDSQAQDPSWGSWYSQDSWKNWEGSWSNGERR